MAGCGKKQVDKLIKQYASDGRDLLYAGSNINKGDSRLMKRTWLGVDTGGTFTDFVFFDGKSIKIHKVLSTPAAPEKAILQGIEELCLDTGGIQLIHGSTVATNAVLEGKGVRTAYITNRGFADVLQIGRQARRELYNLQPLADKPLIEKDQCFELDTRLSAQGEVLQPLSDQQLQQLAAQLRQSRPTAVAINLLFSFLDDRQEKQIQAVVPDGIFISRSSDVLAEYKEYERGMATCLNAYVGPLMEGYLQRLAAGLSGAAVSVMQSAGGTIAASKAGHHAVHLLLSGPAGGLKAAQYVASLSGQSRLLTFDMGGTSTDVALIDGDIGLTSEGHIGTYPVAIPMVDMHTIGAGGGSIAQLDAAGMLLVGPESAGAVPGPACYGQGGERATVTDANLVLGRLQPSAFLGGGMRLDVDAARQAVQHLAKGMGLTLEQTAEGIIRVANEHMVRALRVISVQRGADPGEFTLVSFGGAGGLHVCALAEALGMNQAMVPVQAGVLSALGMLVAAPSRQVSRTITRLIQDCDHVQLAEAFASLETKALGDMQDELQGQAAEVSYSVDCRYQGQSFTLNLAWDSLVEIEQAFHRLHQQRYGHALAIPIELVNLRVSVRGEVPPFELPEINKGPSNQGHGNQGPGGQALLEQVQLQGIDQPVAVYQRQHLHAGQRIEGPALVVETVSTTLLAEHWRCQVDKQGSLLLRRK